MERNERLCYKGQEGEERAKNSCRAQGGNVMRRCILFPFRVITYSIYFPIHLRRRHGVMHRHAPIRVHKVFLHKVR